MCVALKKKLLVDVIPQHLKIQSLHNVFAHLTQRVDSEGCNPMDEIEGPLHQKMGITSCSLCLCSSSPPQLSVCDCLGNCEHQQTQQNNNAQGTILCTGPWEGPVEFLWSVAFWLFSHRPCFCTEMSGMLGRDEVVGHKAIMLLSSMGSVICGLISKWLVVSSMD